MNGNRTSSRYTSSKYNLNESFFCSSRLKTKRIFVKKKIFLSTKFVDQRRADMLPPCDLLLRLHAGRPGDATGIRLCFGAVHLRHDFLAHHCHRTHGYGLRHHVVHHGCDGATRSTPVRALRYDRLCLHARLDAGLHTPLEPASRFRYATGRDNRQERRLVRVFFIITFQR